MNLPSQSACLINPRPRRTVPVSFTYETVRSCNRSMDRWFRGTCRERENHCIPIDPRVNEAVEWWPLTGAFTGLRIIPRVASEFLAVAVLCIVPSLRRSFSFFLPLWFTRVSFWHEIPLSLPPPGLAFPAFLRSRCCDSRFKVAEVRKRRTERSYCFDVIWGC